MKNLETLTSSEKEMLLKFPIYISLLAANWDGKLNETEKKSAISFSHVKTYSCDPLLKEYYHEADKVFEKNIIKVDNELPKGKDERDAAIKIELAKLENILLKLDKNYAKTMRRSMETFKDHVSRAYRNALETFLLPISIKGLTD